jgi:nickel superoxide dismutase
MAASTRAVPGRIFISYRHEDSAYATGRLYDWVANRFGKDQVFNDVDAIKLGDDFVEVITTAVARSDVLLAVIGQRWLTVTDEQRRRRLDAPADYVRLEIEAALKRNISVIPVLVEGARMPEADQLPTSLAKLAHRQALELSPNRFASDIGRLLTELERILAEVPARGDRAPDSVQASRSESVRGGENWLQARWRARQQARRAAETQASPGRGEYAQLRTDEQAPEALKRGTETAARPVDQAMARVYDPQEARIEAESVKAIMVKYQQNRDPEFRARALRIKEQRSELVKQHLWVLWTDYFKPQHFQKYPQLHQLFNEATKLAGAAGTKDSTDVAMADELIDKIEQIAVIFWTTKQNSVT